MSKRTEERLGEVARWYYYHEKTIPRENVEKVLDFQRKTVSCLFEVIAMLIEDVRAAEGRHKSARLWLPDGVTLNGDVRTFG